MKNNDHKKSWKKLTTKSPKDSETKRSIILDILRKRGQDKSGKNDGDSTGNKKNGTNDSENENLIGNHTRTPGRRMSSLDTIKKDDTPHCKENGNDDTQRTSIGSFSFMYFR